MTEQLYYCNHGHRSSATWLYKIEDGKLYQIHKDELRIGDKGGRWREMKADLYYHNGFIHVDRPASDDGVGPIGFQIVKY